MRLVFDTDVVLSGLRSTVGASRMLLLAIEAGVVAPLVSVATVVEYEAVLKRPENRQVTGLDTREIDSFLDNLVAHANHVDVHFGTRPLVHDPDDEMFAEVAINGQADALVSFNLRDYRPAGLRSSNPVFPVYRPGDALRRLQWQPSTTSRSSFLPG